MPKNIMPEVAKLLGVEIGEEFRVRDVDEEQCAKYTVVLLNGGILTRGEGMDAVDNLADFVLEKLLTGHAEIIHIPQEAKP